MPEGLEAEIYRRGAERVVGRTVAAVQIDPRQTQAHEIRAALVGRTVTGTGRVGKQIWLDFGSLGADPPVRLGIHFGMAGRLAVDGVPAIDALAYSSERWNPDWIRLQLDFTADSGGGTLVVNDPRRWSRFVLEPDLARLGPDLFDLTSDELSARLRRRSGPIKSVLLDQSVVAGLGNMLVDEILWRSGIDPHRPANELEPIEVDTLVQNTSELLPTMLAAGGSHTGVLDPERRRDLGRCPHERGSQCDGSLERDSIGGRTTIWCRAHQR